MMSDPGRSTRLRDEIRRAGERTEGLRRTLSFGPVRGVATAIALVAAWLYRHHRGRRLARQVACLAPEEREGLLQDLRLDQHGDVRKLVAGLARALPSSGKEALPAASPAERGTEPTPAP